MRTNPLHTLWDMCLALGRPRGGQKPVILELHYKINFNRKGLTKHNTIIRIDPDTEHITVFMKTGEAIPRKDYVVTIFRRQP